MNYTEPTYYFDYENTAIQNIVLGFKTDVLSQKEKAVKLYFKIRDSWRYNPYSISFSKENYRASVIAQKKDGHCIDKSILYIACLRALGIPARIHLAKVKNHIGVERLIEKFGTNEITPHGMVNVFIDNKWLKASPAFNIELCEKCNVEPLNFDGENDSLFQEYDKQGNNFMDYIEDYGHFEDVPIEFIFNNFAQNYPNIIKNRNNRSGIEL